MDNSALYFEWFSRKGLPPILLPNMVAVDGPDGAIQFAVHGTKSDERQLGGTVRGVLPLVRAYWKFPFVPLPRLASTDSEARTKRRQWLARRARFSPRPPWEPQTWIPLQGREAAWIRFLRADQALDLLTWMHPPEDDPKAFKRQVQRALEGWFVSIDQVLIEQPAILNARVDTVQFTIRTDGKSSFWLDWSRALGGFGNDLRATLVGDCLEHGRNLEDWEFVCKGLDPVHTPENTRAGLVRYLARGWTVGDSGRLVQTSDADNWGASPAAIPFRLHNASRRLMLGASLQTRAVKLLREDEVFHGESPPDWYPPGRRLFAVFSTFDGWTHEDAVVISQSAAQALTSMKTRRIDVFIPRVANRVEVAELGTLPGGTLLVRAFVDLYAMGYRPHEAESLAAANDWRLKNGWLEVELPGAVLAEGSDLLHAERQPTPTSWRWRELITFHLERCAPVNIGDKLATPHGIKGVVSRILPDDETPKFEGRPADIVLSPLGIIRRGAMGQFREAAGGAIAQSLPQAGEIFVVRQPQDAAHPDRFRMLGPDRRGGTVRGQRYGEMEFWALMAHGAHAVANELLSFERSTAHWMRMESEARLGEADHRKLATSALNRFLSMIGARIQEGRFVPPRTDDGRFVVDGGEAAFEIPLPKDHKGLKEWLKVLDDEATFTRGIERGLGKISLPESVDVNFTINEGTPTKPSIKEYQFTVSAVPVLPPWLRPNIGSVPHDLTDVYVSLARCLIPTDEGTKAKLPSTVRRCIAIAMGWRWGRKKMSGVDVFLRREVFGRRLTRSARAVIVPDPTLRIDEITIPRQVADTIFEGLPEHLQRIVLVNRNPTLQRRGLLALRPIIDDSEATVFRLPLGVLKTLAADFDGDQASVVALQTEEAMREAEELLLPGCLGLRSDPFRVKKESDGSRLVEFALSEPAFPLIKEMTNIEEERKLAANDLSSQEDWCKEHADLVRRRILEIGDGWSTPEACDFAAALSGRAGEVKNVRKRRELEKLRTLWQGVEEAEWLKTAADEMTIVYTSVRKKGRYGGVLRRQLYRRAFSDLESFRRSVDALHAVTEPLVQSALSCKSGEAFSFPIDKFFADPSNNRPALQNIEPVHGETGTPIGSRFDEERLCDALGVSVEPSNLLAWFAKPTFQTLLQSVQASESSPTHSADDPRVMWYVG